MEGGSRLLRNTGRKKELSSRVYKGRTNSTGKERILLKDD